MNDIDRLPAAGAEPGSGGRPADASGAGAAHALPPESIAAAAAARWNPLELGWLPRTGRFREELRAASGCGDPAERLERLAALAAHRLGYVETIQLDRALSAVRGPLPAGFTRVRLALLGSTTVDHLLPGIRAGGLRRRLVFDVHRGGFGQFRRELLDPVSGLEPFAPDVILLALDASEWTDGVPIDAAADEAERRLDEAVEGLRRLWEAAGRRFRASVVQQTFLDHQPSLFGSFDRQVPGTPSWLVRRLNDKLAAAAAAAGTLLLDLAGAGARAGTETWFDPASWYHGKIEIAPPAAALYGDLVARLVAAQRGQSRKCLVLDLDNTLWGGVIGDDGPEGIVLGQGSALGEAHLALQRYALALKSRGIILAVSSKNDPAIADAVFAEHPEMVLRRPDFAAFRANWQDKAENLQAIAAELNIGLDSLVFVDDNPVERARIREALPAVAVPELPDDPALYLRAIADAGYFEAVGFTEEDRRRAGQYSANAEREALRDSSGTLEQFLGRLDMVVAAGPVSPVDLTRVTQLVNKTNQFNNTTRRYSAEEMAAIAADRDSLALQFRLADRFGDNGLVSVMLLRPSPGEPEVLAIDSWVMSCRVFGRQLEFEAMNIAVEFARGRGTRAIRADYLPTSKNGVIRNLFPDLGFEPIAAPGLPEGARRWLLELSSYAPRSTPIRRREAGR